MELISYTRVSKLTLPLIADYDQCKGFSPTLGSFGQFEKRFGLACQNLANFTHVALNLDKNLRLDN